MSEFQNNMNMNSVSQKLDWNTDTYNKSGNVLRSSAGNMTPSRHNTLTNYQAYNFDDLSRYTSVQNPNQLL